MVDRGMVDNWGSMVGGSVSLSTGLGGEGEGDLLTAGLSDDDLLLLNSVGGIGELGNIEALVLNLVLALDLSDLNGLGDTDLLGGRVGQLTGDLQGSSDKGDLVGLGLVFLTADLVFSLSISISLISISRQTTGSDLHGLGLLFIGDLGGGARGNNILPLILIGADLPLNNGGGLLADGENTVEAVVIVNNLLDCKSDWSHLLSEGRDTDLSIDRCVCVSAGVLRSIHRGWGIARRGLG